MKSAENNVFLMKFKYYFFNHGEDRADHTGLFKSDRATCKISFVVEHRPDLTFFSGNTYIDTDYHYH